MSLLSTLRPLSSRLQDRFWWILAHLSVPGEVAATFSDLNDDILLLLLEYLLLPDLLQLRAVSRHLNELITRHRLAQYRTLLYGYTTAETMGREDEQQRVLLYGNEEAERRKRLVEQANLVHQQVKLYMSTYCHAFSEFNLPRRLTLCDHSSFFCRPRRLFPVKLTTLPPSLPTLLPRLASLTFSHFLVSAEESLSEEEWSVNRLCAHYLSSSWADTLVSLHLYLHVPARPQPEKAFFLQMGKLSALKHLNLELSRYVAQEPNTPSLLPDSHSVLSQLTSFALANYGGRNTALLLTQLGPQLVYLSLWDVACSVEDYASFLASKPTYSRTLKRVEILLHGKVHLKADGTECLNLHWRIFTLTAAHCLALERAVIMFASRHADLVPFFAALHRLTRLREFSVVALHVNQLRTLLHLQNPNPGTFPRLSTVRRVAFHLYSREPAFDASELFDSLLPPLADLFPRLDFLDISFSQEKSGERSEPLSIQLLSRASQLFKGVRYCTAAYFCRQV